MAAYIAVKVRSGFMISSGWTSGWMDDFVSKGQMAEKTSARS